MKVCTVEHDAPGFGTIPVGSLWADDSPYAVAADCFAEVDDPPAKPAKPRTPSRKFGQPAIPEEAPE